MNGLFPLDLLDPLRNQMRTLFREWDQRSVKIHSVTMLHICGTNYQMISLFKKAYSFLMPSNAFIALTLFLSLFSFLHQDVYMLMFSFIQSFKVSL